VRVRAATSAIGRQRRDAHPARFDTARESIADLVENLATAAERLNNAVDLTERTSLSRNACSGPWVHCWPKWKRLS